MKVVKLLLLLLILIISYTNIIQAKKKKPKRSKTSSSVPYPMVMAKDSLIQTGFTYQNILFGSRKTKISANILEIDLVNSNLSVEVIKAKNNTNELDKLQNIMKFTDTSDTRITYGGINASFWKAIRNNPIGPCIIDGSVVEMNPYKEWSSIFIDLQGMPYIDNFKLDGFVKLHDGKTIRISTVNRRRDSNGIVFYNSFGGKVIPHLSDAAIDNMITLAYEELLQDSTFMNGDSTELEFSYEEFEKNIIDNNRTRKIESSMTKALIEFIDRPSINRKFRAVVNYVDTGSVNINKNQGILSFGCNLPPDIQVYYGDTLELLFRTDILPDKEFMFAASATPRLVRQGKAAHEAYREGSKSRRFINGQLGRTSIGYNQDRTKMFLVTIDHANSSMGRKGASLSELAQIMKQIGCYEAMNLDGGGSSIMVIDGKNIMAKNNPSAGRRISVGIGVRSIR